MAFSSARIHSARTDARLQPPPRRPQFVADSPLEEMDSNHRSPARKSRFLLRKANCGTERGQPKRVVSYAVPMVRIHLPPAASQERTPPSRSLAHFTDGQVSGRIGTTVRGRGRGLVAASAGVGRRGTVSGVRGRVAVREPRGGMPTRAGRLSISGSAHATEPHLDSTPSHHDAATRLIPLP